MRLDEPVELLRELEENAPFDFNIRRTSGDNLVLDVDEDQDPSSAPRSPAERILAAPLNV